MEDYLLAHIEEFEGLEVRGYDPLEQGLGDQATTCPRLFTIYEFTRTQVEVSTTRKVAALAVAILTAIGAVVWSWLAVVLGLVAVAILLSPTPPPLKPDEIELLWERFFAEERISEVQALVIGPWFTADLISSEAVVEELIAGADKLTGLRALFLGDVVGEECEISWIEQCDLADLLGAYPNLETLVVRGANGLRFEGLRHDKLRKLVVQSGGLGPQTIADIVSAELPSLEHVELWLGDENYGFESSVEELWPLWQLDKFEALSTLALRNCTIADEVAEALAVEPEAVARLERLDLSLGALTDLGAAALFNNPGVLQLDALDVHHHYLSDDWVEKLQSMPIEVDASDAQGYADPEDEEDYRYVAVSE
jgi:hypothetical protein